MANSAVNSRGATQYIGARYVPLFADPLEWSSANTYEPLTIVLHEGNSYTSRQYVPVGIDISNESYWALTGNYNAQIEQYRQEVAQYDQRITQNQTAIETIDGELDEAKTSIETIDGELDEAKTSIEAIDGELDKKAPTNHASNDATYGLGTQDLYGHVKVQDSIAPSDVEKAVSKAVSAYFASQQFAHLHGGAGTLVYNLEAQNGVTLSSVANQNYIARNKATNEFVFNCKATNDTNSIIPAGTPLIRIKPFNCRYLTKVQIAIKPIVISADDERIVSTTTCILQPNAAGYCDISIGYALPASGGRVEFIGTCSSASMQGKNVNNQFYDETLGTQICNYFLNGSTNWMGKLNYSQNDDGRLTPETSGYSDCSGLIYAAYNHFGFHPQNSVQPSYVSNGIPLAYAAVGEPLDTSNAVPGDIICYQNASGDLGDWSSWTHACIYAGNDTVYEMALHYPSGSGGTDNKGPFKILIPASTYRSVTYDSKNVGRNRMLVRLL